MPRSQSKTWHKKVGKEKVINCEGNASSPGEAKPRCRRQCEGKSRGQPEGRESLPEQGDNLGEEPLKSQRMVRLPGSKDNGHKKLFRGKRACKRTGKRESGAGRNAREQLVSKSEGKKGKACEEQDMTLGRESEDSSTEEEEATSHSKEQGFKKQPGKCPAVSGNAPESGCVKSTAVRSGEGSPWKWDSPQEACNARQRGKPSESCGFGEASEQDSVSQSQGSITQGKGERSGKKQVGKHTRIIVTENAEENIPASSGGSCSDSSNEGSWSHEEGAKEAGVGSSASSEEKSGAAGEGGAPEGEAMLKDAPAAQGRGDKKLPGESHEASPADGSGESGGEGAGFAGLEAEEITEKPGDVPRQPRSFLAESSEKDDAASISGFPLKGLKNRENCTNEASKANMSENDQVQDMQEDTEGNSECNENSTAESTDRGKENATKQPRPGAVKAELDDHLGRGLRGAGQEQEVSEEGRVLADSPLLPKQQGTLKEKPGRRETAVRDKAVGQQRGRSSGSKQGLTTRVLTKKCSSQSQTLPNLEKYKNAETKLLTSCKPNPVQMALEAKSDLKNAESICSKPTTLETLSTQKESNIAQSFGEKGLNLSNIASCSGITKISSAKQLLGKKKKVGEVAGKVKLSSGQASETQKEKAEVVAEAPSVMENVCDGKGSKDLPTHSAFRKVTSWLGQKPAKKVSLKARLLSVARAVGISRWLLKNFGKRKRSSKALGLRSRAAIRVVSAAGRMGQSGKALPGAAGELGRAQLNDKESSPPLAEGNKGPKTAEEVGHVHLPPDGCPLHGTSSFPYLLRLDEDNGATDAKFAIVSPRVHSVVKTKSSLSRGSGNGCSLEKLRSLSDRKCAMPLQRGCRLNCDLRRTWMDQRPQTNREQNFLPHREEDPIHTSDYSSSADVRGSAGVPQPAASKATAGLHWSQQCAQGCDAVEWLSSELLLPRPTLVNLSKWAMSKDPHLANSSVVKVCKEQWEAEDVPDSVLEVEFRQEQVDVCEQHRADVEEIEDLTRLEEVCESSVLLCLKKRFHRNLIYTYIGQILVSVNPFKELSIYSEDVAAQYQQRTLSKNAPHIFAIAEMAYVLSQSSGQEQCVVISGHSGSGKTEAGKAIVRYLTLLYQGSDTPGTRQPCDVLPILESFGNARTILNDNSSRFGKLLNVHLRRGVVVGISISQYLLEKSRVVFQAHGERNFHVFYELLAGLPGERKEQLYLQGAESYFYLNQGRACDILGKEDGRDFVALVQALENIHLSEDQLASTWAVLAAVLQLGNICFTCDERESYEHAVLASDTEIQIVANLLCVSADFLQRAVTHRVTVTSYDRIFSPLSVEGAIDARDSIAKTLYFLLFEWLLLRINEWLAPWEPDCAVGIVDIHGFEDLGVNSLEQLCINFANEHLQRFFSQTIIAQEEEEYSQEHLAWVPISKMYNESCLDLIAAKPHGIWRILDDQTLLTQATDHTFLQKCHYHHGDSPGYAKPRLPLPVFTVKHYAGPVTYQVHKFLNKNRDQLRPEVLEIFSQSQLKVVSHIFKKAKAAYSQQWELGTRGKGLKPQASTLVSKFQQSLEDLTAKLRRSHIFFIRCITPNLQKLSNIFDVEYVTCQLRHSGILEAIHIRKKGYPVRLPFQNFLARYGILAGRGHSCLEEREGCVAVLSRVVGHPSELYEIGVTKVFLKERARQLLERRRAQRLRWALATLQRSVRCLLRRRRLRALQEKATIIQAHFRGYQARKRYRRLRKTLVQFNTMILVSRPLTQRRRRCQKELEERNQRSSLARGPTENSPDQRMDVGLLEIPAELAALLHRAEGQYHAQANQITETLPPEVKVKDDLSLPPTINSYPFSSFIKSHFQKADFPVPGHPLQQPLTELDAQHQESALEVNKLILRFIGDKSVQGWQEVLLGNYIAERGLSNVALRNEIFSQVVTQAWKNPDMELSQRAWVLMATLLSCFAPSPALEKPLLKFVSDHGMEGYNAVCQRKILTAAQHTEMDPTFSRAYPPTQLEWTANQRRGKMVLDVHTFNEEKFSAEVESWMTGEQYAGWLLSARGCDKKSRGWSVSMFTGNTWQDLLGCDFVLDLIGEMEETSNLSIPSESSAGYPITAERDRTFLQSSDLELIPPAPGIQAPAFPPPSLPPEFSDLHPDQRFRDDLRTPVGLDHYVDDLFSTVLHQGSRVPDMENRESLTGRMKGGGKIGPTQRGIFPSTGFPGMTQAPVYQPVPSMVGMPAAMPMMPAAGGIAPVPAMVMPQPMVPAVDPNQLAAQQQAFINQQAMLMAQQMTLQAISISQQQQQQQQKQQQQQQPLENSRPRVSSPPQARASAPATLPKPKKPPITQNAAPSTKAPELPAKAEEPAYDYMEDQFSNSEDDDNPRETFQQKREYFQKMGEQQIRVKKVRPSKTWTPPANPQPKQEEKKEETEKMKEEKPSPKPEAAPAPSFPPPEPKPKKQAPKTEPPVVKPAGPESRPKPSREIHNIIKMYQSRPAPEPLPIEPVRRSSKPFIKKSDPKDEALAKLGMMNLPPSKSPAPVPQEKKTPPPPKPKPKAGSASSSIKEKQLPLLSIVSQGSTPPASQTPPASPPASPPLPSSLLPGNQGWQESPENASTTTVAEDEGIKTQLYKLTASVSFSYVNPAWKIFLRKEVFYPRENFSHPYCLNLLCEQIMRDTFSDSCLRISREEKRKMKDLLMLFQVGNDVQSIQEDGIKKRIVLAARDNWANYFSRLFPVHGENGSDVQLLGVSHRGVRLLKVVKAAGWNPEHLKILRSYSFADVLAVELKGSNALEFSLKTEQLLLHSPKASCIKAMVELFIQELRQDTNYVVALRSYVADDKSLLSFQKGDLIELLPMQGVEPGWQFGSSGGRCGIFPTSLVQLAAAPDYLSSSMDRRAALQKSTRASPESRNPSRESSAPSLTSEPDSVASVPAGDRYTMTDFATAYFRGAQFVQGLKGVAADKRAADLVQHTKVPIQESLLRFSDSELNELATKNFLTVMQFMGDQPKPKNQTEAECIYEILQLCKEKESLHDEVYCQVIKQVTYNPNQEGVLHGWLLLNLLTGYFLPSNVFMPYATKFLQLASSDPSSNHHDTAKICQSNLRKNFLYGGRRHLPFPVEIEALLKGHGARRLVVLMPGGIEYLTRVQTFTVAKELLQEICEQMGAGDQEETEEFVLFATRSNSNNDDKTVRPIRSEEYLHDYLLEDRLVTVSLRRLLWRTPLHFENRVYTDVHYGQVLWDYLSGRILLSHSKEMETQVGLLALLQHWAKAEQQSSAPSREELMEYTPKTLQSSISSQALQTQVAVLLGARERLPPLEAKVQFIEHVMKLPFFGYNTYFVKRVSDATISAPCFLGVNKEEIIVVDGRTQVVSCLIPLRELQKMRTLRPVSAGGLPGIELNYGSAASPRTMWLELAQAKEMYHTIVVILDKTELHH